MIFDGVLQIKELSKDMNKELGLHARLLDDIDSTHDKLEGQLGSNTDGIEHITEESRSCCTILTILILFLLIVFLAATNYACYVFNQDRC